MKIKKTVTQKELANVIKLDNSVIVFKLILAILHYIYTICCFSLTADK